MREQLELYGTLTGHPAQERTAERPREDERLADVLALPRRPADDAPARRPMSSPLRVAVLQGGRSLERQVSLVSGARVAHALERRGHVAIGIDVGHDLVTRLREARPDVVFVALHGKDGEDGTVQELLEALGLPYTGAPPAGCARSLGQGARQGADARRRNSDARRARLQRDDALKELGAADALGAVGERLGFPVVVKPACRRERPRRPLRRVAPARSRRR